MLVAAKLFSASHDGRRRYRMSHSHVVRQHPVVKHEPSFAVPLAACAVVGGCVSKPGLQAQLEVAHRVKSAPVCVFSSFTVAFIT